MENFESFGKHASHSPKLSALEDENVEMTDLENREALGLERYARPEVGANEDVPNCIIN